MHSITSVTVGITTFNMLDDYGKLTSAQVEEACLLHNNVHTSLHAKQYAQMMYECVMNSIMEEAKSSLASQDHVMFHKDGPSLFFHIVMQLSTATFSNAQATCDKLADFHPKCYKYDILQVNNYIHIAIKCSNLLQLPVGQSQIKRFSIFSSKSTKRLKHWLNGHHIAYF